jgi:transcriptional regulator with XRE-family HTH domain
MSTKTGSMPKRETIPGMSGKLRGAREAAGLSQQQAADKAGLYQATIARYETDDRVPTLGALYKLAAAYGVKVCDLLPDPPKKPAKPKK